MAKRDVQVLHRPRIDAKVRDIVALYLNPPGGAVVLCIDEKSQIQALYVRHGTRVVCDSYATHKHPKVRAWLERNQLTDLKRAGGA